MVLLRVQISYPSKIHSTTQSCKECYSENPVITMVNGSLEESKDRDVMLDVVDVCTYHDERLGRNIFAK